MVFNETVILASPLIKPIVAVVETASVIVGGIFGIYVILLVLRWIEYKKFGKVLRDMRSELRELNAKISSAKVKVQKVYIKPKKSSAKKKKK